MTDNQVADELPDKKPEGEEEEEAPPESLKEFIQPDNAYQILQNRWPLFTGWAFIIYSYHFVMCIYGVDMFCHYTRFAPCGDGATDVSYENNTAALDAWIFINVLFHMIEWIRQWVFLTTVLVGINWLPVYYALSVNIPFGLLSALIGCAMGFSADAQCQENQSERTTFLKLQILSFVLYMMWSMMHIVVFMVMDKFVGATAREKDDKGKEKPDGKILYKTWCQEQFCMEDEDDD